jgi:hypothetical protein
MPLPCRPCPEPGRTRARLTGNRFWGTALLVAALVPASAGLVGHRPWIVTGAATVTLLMCGVAALVSGSARTAGNVLLAAALLAGLLLVFWLPGDVLQIVIAIVLLTISGFAIRGAVPPGSDAVRPGTSSPV